MAAYTITVNTNAKQETALTAIVAAVNVDRAAQTPPLTAITNQQYLDAIVTKAVVSYRQQYEQQNGDAIKAALMNATDVQIAGIKTTLGLS